MTVKVERNIGSHQVGERGNTSEALEVRKTRILTLLEQHRNNIPEEVWNTSIGRINTAFEEFLSPEQTATSAFFVHTRRDRNGGPVDEAFRQIDDSTRCLPVLNPDCGIPEEAVEEIWNLLPPFKVGEIKGTFNGRKINCAIISVPITPKGLEEQNSQTGRAKYARGRIKEATELAKKMGAKLVGLGETLAAQTSHGESLEEEFPDLQITTGHAFTVYFMTEWTKFAAEKLGLDLKNEQITIIGANGSIGSAMTEMLLREGVGRLNLHDTERMVGALQNRAKDIEKRYPELKGKINATGGNGNLREACKGSKLVLVASSAPKPFIEAKHLDLDTVVINDSQPPSMTREEAEKAEATTIWVVGALPHGLENTFKPGLLGRAEWTCLLEILALEAGVTKPWKTVGPVTPERVVLAGQGATELGMRLPEPQSWGKKQDLGSSVLAVSLH